MIERELRLENAKLREMLATHMKELSSIKERLSKVPRYKEELEEIKERIQLLSHPETRDSLARGHAQLLNTNKAGKPQSKEYMKRHQRAMSGVLANIQKYLEEKP